MGERYRDNNQLEAVLADYQRLKEENAALRRLLVDNGITILAPPKLVTRSGATCAECGRR